MKKNFQFSLDPNDFFKKILPYQIGVTGLLILFYIFYFIGVINLNTKPTMFGGVAIFLAIIVFIPLLIVCIIYSIIVLKCVIPGYSYDNGKFDFKGEVGKYLGINVIGLLLTIITCGIYMAWYYAKSYKYLTEEIYYKDKNFSFTGKGSNLFVILLLTVAIPIIVLSVIFGIFISISASGGGLQSLENPVIMFVLIIFLYAVIILMTIAANYKISEWYYNNIKYENKSIFWNTKFVPSFLYVLGQILLSIITCGIYSFAAIVKINKYFTERTEIVDENGKVIGKFGFEGTTGSGFVLLLVQSLLLMVTIGFYTPWYYAKVNKWFAENTYIDEIE